MLGGYTPSSDSGVGSLECLGTLRSILAVRLRSLEYLGTLGSVLAFRHRLPERLWMSEYGVAYCTEITMC